MQFAIGQRVTWHRWSPDPVGRGEIVEFAGGGRTPQWKIRSDDAGIMIVMQEKDLCHDSPLAPFEPILSHYTALARLALEMGIDYSKTIHEAQQVFLHLGFGGEWSKTFAVLILNRAEQGFTYSASLASDERRDAILAAVKAAVKAEMEASK